MTREFPTRDLGQIRSLYKVVLCVGSLFSEEYNTVIRLEALYVTHTEHIETSVQILIFIFKKFYSIRTFDPHLLKQLINLLSHDVSNDTMSFGIDILFKRVKKWRNRAIVV